MSQSDHTPLFSSSDEWDLLHFERFQWKKGLSVAGVDEAGRGCLAGPVVAAAAIFPQNLIIPEVNDSKKLSAKKRLELSHIIREKAISWAVGLCSPTEIDELNILWASMEAMRRAIMKLHTAPEYVLIDGNKSIPHLSIRSRSIVKGDSLSHSIAAASILAKTHRDALMHELHDTHPEYGWETNVGYPTAAHYAALHKNGPTEHHRRSFRLQ